MSSVVNTGEDGAGRVVEVLRVEVVVEIVVVAVAVEVRAVVVAVGVA